MSKCPHIAPRTYIGADGDRIRWCEMCGSLCTGDGWMPSHKSNEPDVHSRLTGIVDENLGYRPTTTTEKLLEALERELPKLAQSSTALDEVIDILGFTEAIENGHDLVDLVKIHVHDCERVGRELTELKSPGIPIDTLTEARIAVVDRDHARIIELAGEILKRLTMNDELATQWVVVWNPTYNKGPVAKIFKTDEAAYDFARQLQSEGWPKNVQVIRASYPEG